MNNKGKLLWYIARADLSRPGDAPALHSREDVRGLKKCGWNAALLACASGAVETPEGVEEVIVQNMNAPLERLFYELKIVYRLIHGRTKPDFVFFRGPTNLIIIGIALTLLKIPFGVELNGVLLYRFHKIWRLRHWIEKLADKFFMKYSSVVVGVTEELSAQAEKECNQKTIVVTARNGVAIDEIYPVKARSTHLDLKIGFLGKAYQDRGLEQALEIVKELRLRGVDAGLLAVGGGPEVNHLLNYACTLGLQDVVEFREAVAPGQMATEVADCHIMWASFENNLNFQLSGLSPLKIWTYLAIGKPVFVKELDMLAAYHGVPGLLWTTGSNGSELTDELMGYWAQHGKEGFAKLGELGREYVEANVSWTKHAEIISEAINSALLFKDSTG